jgi:hypothetical protein
VPVKGGPSLPAKGVDISGVRPYSNTMNCRVLTVIFLLIVALLIQNTCPKGFAGKSTVVSASACSHCPHKHFNKPMPLNDRIVVANASDAQAHLPLFVLDTPDTKPAFLLEATASPQPAIPNTYKNTAPDGLLQPPRA